MKTSSEVRTRLRRKSLESSSLQRAQVFAEPAENIYGLVTSPNPRHEARKADYLIRREVRLGMIGSCLGFLVPLSFVPSYWWLENAWALSGPILCLLILLAASPLIIKQFTKLSDAAGKNSTGHEFYLMGLGFLGPHLGVFSLALLYVIRQISS